MKGIGSVALYVSARGKPCQSPFARLGGFDLAIPRGRRRLERGKKLAGDGGNLVDGREERGFVGLRRLVKTADLAHELQRGRANLLVRHRRGEIEEDPDVSTHVVGLVQVTGVCTGGMGTAG